MRSSLRPDQSRVVAVVPAYNEAPRIGEVLGVLTSYPFDDVIVVDDGSTDDTLATALLFPVVVLQQKHSGKGRAMDLGVQASGADVIFFCDADVAGLTHEVIDEVLALVLAGKIDMMIAMCHRRIYFIKSIFHFVPLLSGQRALTSQLWKQVPARYKDRFMIETALNFYARYYGRGFRFTVFKGMSHTVKEVKYGFWAGFRSRLKMFYEITYAQVSLWCQHLK